MKRVVLAIKNRLVSEAVLDALKKRGIYAQKTFAHNSETILDLVDALMAGCLIMDVTRGDDSNFEKRMKTVEKAKFVNPELKIALLCDNVSNKDDAYKIKCAKEEKKIDAFFYESVTSDYLADVIDSL